jgi:hypothetical protein
VLCDSWRSAFHALRLICGRDARRQRLDQSLKGRAVGVFGSVARLQFFLDLSAVNVNRSWCHGLHPRNLFRLAR